MQRPAELIGVEGVHGMAEFQHHIIGDVDCGTDRTNPGSQQPLDHPPWRLRGWVDAGDPPCSKALHPGGFVDANRPGFALCGKFGCVDRFCKVEVETAS